MASTTSPRRTGRSIWLGPLVSALVLAVLFVVATLVRRSAWADEARPFMIGLSAGAAAVITLHGARTAAARRGWAGIVAGALMIGMGVYTLFHVLR